MTSDIRATLIRIQQRVVEHYNRVLKQPMSDSEKMAIRERLAREESVLSDLLDRKGPGVTPAYGNANSLPAGTGSVRASSRSNVSSMFGSRADLLGVFSGTLSRNLSLMNEENDMTVKNPLETTQRAL
jgi:hypothetical protein